MRKNIVAQYGPPLTSAQSPLLLQYKANLGNKSLQSKKPILSLSNQESSQSTIFPLSGGGWVVKKVQITIMGDALRTVICPF